MWAGGGIAVTSCPVSLITAESLSVLEEYSALKTMAAQADWRRMPARFVEGCLVIENELAKERGNGGEFVGRSG